jgi:hypothetical protein
LPFWLSKIECVCLDVEHLFMYLVAFCKFSRELSAQFNCPFSSWIILLVFNFWAPAILCILIIIWWIASKDFLPFFILSFHSLHCFHWCVEVCWLDAIPFVSYYSYFLRHWSPIKKQLPMTISSGVSLCFL